MENTLGLILENWWNYLGTIGLLIFMGIIIEGVVKTWIEAWKGERSDP
jgi:uncharacterized membrane protein YraQ (UPF0718 family)